MFLGHQAGRGAAPRILGPVRKLLQCVDLRVELADPSLGVLREREYLEEELRQLVFKSYRLVFRVDQATDTVYVVAVRHGCRRAMGEPGEDD